MRLMQAAKMRKARPGKGELFFEYAFLANHFICLIKQRELTTRYQQIGPKIEANPLKFNAL